MFYQGWTLASGGMATILFACEFTGWELFPGIGHRRRAKSLADCEVLIG